MRLRLRRGSRRLPRTRSSSRRSRRSACTWRRCMMRSASGYGSGRSSTPLMTLKIAVLAPMPRPSVRMKASENPGIAGQRAQREADVRDHSGGSSCCRMSSAVGRRHHGSVYEAAAGWTRRRVFLGDQRRDGFRVEGVRWRVGVGDSVGETWQPAGGRSGAWWWGPTRNKIMQTTPPTPRESLLRQRALSADSPLSR